MLNKLVFTGKTIVDSQLFGGVKYSHSCNADTDLTVGTTACAEVSFTTNALQPDSLNSSFTYNVKFNGNSNYNTVGVFNIKEVTKSTHGKYDVKAYDNISKFDIIVDSWIDSLTFPITLKDMFTSLCTYCGCTAGSTTFTNYSMKVNDNFTGINITGRTVLGYIAQCAGGFAKANANGSIAITKFTTSSTTLDRTKYKSFWYADYNAPVIDKVWVGQEDGDTGVTSGTGNNVLNIESNPLLFANSASEIQTYVNNIYNVVKAYNYTPCKIELIKDFGIDAGSIITVNGITTMIMSKSWDNSGVRMESTGNATREIASSQNSEILALRGKTNVLTRTLEETTNKMTSIETNVNAEINGVKTELTTVKTDVSEVKQTANSLSSTVSSVQQDLNDYKSGTDTKLSNMESKIEQQADSITTTVTNNVNTYVDGKFTGVNQEITQIKQDATSLTSTVQGLSGDVNTVKQSLEGVVYSSSLADGTTTINGGCIKTGTISADRINMTGAISWGDLDSNLQTTINDAGGSGGLTEEEVTTLITDQLVSSPTIAGGKFTDLNKKNYIKMGSSSDNSVGYLNHYFTPYSTSDPICVMGYQKGTLPNWVLAPYNVPVLSFARQSSTSGLTAAMGNWDFSSATVTGLNLSGEVTVKAVWGA